MGATTPEEILNMSDEDFMNELAPVVEPAAVKTPEEIAAEEAAALAAQQAQEAEAQRLAEEQAKATGTTPPAEVPGAVVLPADEPDQKTPEQLAAEQVAADAAKAQDGKPDNTGSVDYQKAYEAIMAPFKANGKMMQVKEEVSKG